MSRATTVWVTVGAVLLAASGWWVLDRDASNRAFARAGASQRAGALVRTAPVEPAAESDTRQVIEDRTPESDSSLLADGSEGVVVRGRVTDRRSGVGVEAATVTFGSGKAGERVTASTDAQGRFEAKPAGETNFLAVAHPDYAPTFLGELDWGTGRRLDVDIELLPGARLLVQVEAPGPGNTNVPVSGATVEVLLAHGDQAPWLSSDERDVRTIVRSTAPAGEAEFTNLPVGAFRLFARAPGTGAWQGSVDVPLEGAAVRVALHRAARLDGTVRDSVGARVEGATVLLSPGADFRGDRSRVFASESTTTDASGAFQFEDVPYGKVFVTVIDDRGVVGYGPDGGVEITGEPAAPVELVLPLVKDVVGRLVDDSGAAVPNADLRLKLDDLAAPSDRVGAGLRLEVVPGLSARVERRSTTDPSGRFTWRDVSVHTRVASVVFRHEGYMRERWRLGPARLFASTGVELVARRLAPSIVGRFQGAATRSLAGLPVRAWADGDDPSTGAIGISDADGRFEIPVPVVAARFVVRPAWETHPFARLRGDPAEVSGVEPGGPPVVFDVREVPVLTGTVVDAATGLPVQAFELALFSDVDGGFRPPSLYAGDAGRFELGFDPRRDLFLRVCAEGYEPIDVRGLELAVEEDLGVALQRGSTLSGNVVTAEGDPVDGAVIALTTRAFDSPYLPSGRFAPAASTDATGHFELDGVPRQWVGTLVVCADRDGTPPLAYFDVVPKGVESPVRLVLPPTHPVTLRVASSQGGSPDGQLALFDHQERNLNPAAEPALARVAPTRWKRVLRFEGGTLTTELAEGRYELRYLPEGGGTIETFEFSVPRDDDQAFEFLTSR
ncbi:MAG: hypothetical protein GC161_18625 [Planctomycetaceae bacterium]|nr:hypothetical protein [Planctomycetaceae bacterium]